MAFVISHFYPGGTEEQYRSVLAAAHPGDRLPPGQTYHAAGPSEGGWLIVAVWDSKESFETFVSDTLMPALQGGDGGFGGPPEQHTAEVVNLVTA